MSNALITDQIRSIASKSNLDAKYGPYVSTEAADQELGPLGPNGDVRVAGLTVGIIQGNGSIKEYWYQPNRDGSGLGLVLKLVSEVDSSLSSTSTNPVQNKVITSELNKKVDKVSGKGLSSNDFTNDLKSKLDGMPTIVSFDPATDRITIGGKVYQLTPFLDVPDYYVGWTTGSISQFNSLTDDQLKSIVGQGKLISQNPIYTRNFNNDIIFFLLYKESQPPTEIILTSAGTPLPQNLITDNNFSTHPTVTYDGVPYKLFGIRIYGIDPDDSMTVKFN